MQSTTLKKPFGVYALALLFILAPLGNILISFAGSGVENWYSPSIFFVFLESIPLADWAWLILTFVTGCLLFVQHKTAWSLAVLSLLVVLGINAYRAFNPGDVASVEFLKWQIVISMLVTLAVLVLAFYFRFPYLDRRAQWFFPTAHRWDLRTPVEVVGEDIFQGVTESLSISGARINLQRDMGDKSRDMRFVTVILPEVKKLRLKAQIIEYRDNRLRVKFKDLSGSERQILQDWIESKSQNET